MNLGFFSLKCLALTVQWVVFPTTIAETSIESPFGLSNAQLGLLTSLYIPTIKIQILPEGAVCLVEYLK